MVQPLGVADDWVVRQHIKRYELGDIALVENVLQGEKRDHSTKHTLSTQQTFMTESEKTTEATSDVQTTDRFDLKSEISNTLKEDTSVKAGVSVKYDSAPWCVTANVDVSYQRSKEEATKTASEQLRDVVRRATTKVTERILQQQTTQIIETFEDATDHSFDNQTQGVGNVIGIYQWLNKVMHVQMFDLGPRQIFDIMVPEPAALLWDIKPPPPSQPLPTKPAPFATAPQQLDYTTVSSLVAQYSVSGVPKPPEPNTHQSHSFGSTIGSNTSDNYKSGVVESADIEIPDGYAASAATVTATFSTADPDIAYVDVEVAGKMISFGNNEVGQSKTVLLDSAAGSVSTTVIAHTVNSFTASVDLSCDITREHTESWQLEAHDAILAAYNERVKEYQEALSAQQIQAAQAASAITGTNPDSNRDIERIELKRLAIGLLAGKTIDLLGFDSLLPSTFDAAGPNYPRANADVAEWEGRIARFFEEALEWENMNYVLYPYYWARKETWYPRILANDADPLFAQFLRAGQARVVVPVRNGFESDVQYFVQSGGQLWKGAPLPDVHSADYLPIAKEIEAAENPELGVPGDFWEATLPTNQVCLSDVPYLPSWTVDDKWNWTPTPPPK
jgi:hypothetical protein